MYSKKPATTFESMAVVTHAVPAAVISVLKDFETFQLIILT